MDGNRSGLEVLEVDGRRKMLVVSWRLILASSAVDCWASNEQDQD